jgi:hypothetical protein
MDPASAVSPAHSARARSLTKELRPPPGNLGRDGGQGQARNDPPHPEKAVGATWRLPHLPNTVLTVRSPVLDQLLLCRAPQVPCAQWGLETS